MFSFYKKILILEDGDEMATALPTPGKGTAFNIKNFVKIVAVVSLVAAYIAGYFLQKNESYNAIRNHFPEMQIITTRSTPPVYTINSSSNPEKEKRLVIGSTYGWGGPLETGTVIDTAGRIVDVIVLKHRETPAFFKALISQHFFEQFLDLNLSAPFQVGQDIDAVSGATVSSEAFARAVRQAAHWTGRNEYNLEIEEAPKEWQLGANEFILIVLYAVVIISAIKKFSKIRKVVLLFSLGFIGFYLNYPISVSNFSQLLLGYFPSIYEHTFWWLLVVGTLLLTLFYGRNLYCSWMCPFGAMQEFITLIGGVRLRLSKKIIHAAEYSIYFFFWLAFMIIFLTSNPSMGTYEPFATLFGFKGIGIQWYLVSVALIGSFLIPRFWCRFFCPVGAFLKQVLKFQKAIVQKIQMGINNFAN
jgi:Na+-translocating ferredoxin:NAD+ oxidoreductase RnfG subunit